MGFDPLTSYIEKILAVRLSILTGKEYRYKSVEEVPLPELTGQKYLDAVANKNEEGKLNFTLISMALIPHVAPGFYDEILNQFFEGGKKSPQVGGVIGKNHGGFLPTGETAQFIIAGKDQGKRLQIQQLLGPHHFFAKKGILWLEEVPEGEPKMSGKLVLAPDYVDLFTTGEVTPPKFGKDFPAEKIETPLEWKDLKLEKETAQQIEEIQSWLTYGSQLMSDPKLGKRLKPGYRALFYGPPGTGKTLTASLLGKRHDKPVYRIDLSLVVSKYIGETEKNLASLFAKAEGKDWILFFDEADALFGKRTEIKDAHDRYANQEIAYLLQRIEHYNGLVILASNMKKNIDEAFLRRFQSIIHFPLPKTENRKKLWLEALPKSLPLDKEVDINAIAQKHKISGAAIVNVAFYAGLQAISRKGKARTLQLEDFMTGIRRELAKEGKVV